MADPHSDIALDALLDRYVPGSMLDSSGTAELVEQCRRLRAERDEARRVARSLATVLAQDVGGGLELDPDEAAALESAFGYPEVPHG